MFTYSITSFRIRVNINFKAPHTGAVFREDIMSFVCRTGGIEDLTALAEIERKATPSNLYLVDCAEEFLDPARGELVVAVENDIPRGFAHFSLQPDGSGWLECLRVDPEHQKRGCGTEIWRRFMELCELYRVPHVGMYTGLKNYASRVLGERNGLSVDYQNREGSLTRDEAPEAEAPCGFTLVSDPDEVQRAIAPYEAGYHGYFCMNRTYNLYSVPLYRYLAQEQSVWVKGGSTVVLGARFLRDRALYIGMMGGDIDECIRFAIAKFKKSGLPKLIAAIPSDREDLKKAMERYGFSFPQSEIIVLQRSF